MHNKPFFVAEPGIMSKQLMGEKQMSKKDNFESAFPCHEYGECGMSLRDYFAAKAMAAMLTIEDVHLNYGESQLARWSYDQADAMLRQRMVPVDSSNESA